MSVIDEIIRNTGVRFRAATPQESETLRSLGMPAEAIEFYRRYLPTRIVEIARVRLWTLNELILENSDDVLPGCYAVPCGYTIFASNDCGDAYGFDRPSASSNTAPIVLIAHDLEPPDDKMVREDLAKLAKPIAESFERCLESFVAGTLDREPVYASFDRG